MAHFAKVLNGRVTQVIKADQTFFDTFVDDTPGEWIQTSYNTYGGIHYQRNEDGSLAARSADQSLALRYNFAHIDGHYDAAADAFYAPKQYDKWILNTNTYIWEAPIVRPTDDKSYYWDDTNEKWTEFN
jgi:hypothetical protein